MNLTRFSDIGLQVLILLTRYEYGISTASLSTQHTQTEEKASDTEVTRSFTAPAHRRRFTTNEVAERIDAPRSHVAKVVAKLTEMGALHSSRGRLGGISLAADPAVLTVGEVLRHLERHNGLVTYQSGKGDAASAHDSLQPYLLEAEDAFYQSLEKVSILVASQPRPTTEREAWVARPAQRSELPIAVNKSAIDLDS